MVESQASPGSRSASGTGVSRDRELLDSIVENIPVLLCVWDPALQKFELNRECERVLGWNTADANSGDFMAMVYPDPEYRKSIAEYMRSLAPGWREARCAAKNGSEIPIEWANIRLSDDRMVGIGIDVRERHQAQQRLQTVLNSITDGLMVLDHEWRFSYLSEQGARMVGLAREELIGRSIWDLFPAAKGTRFYECYHRAMETGQAVQFEEFYPEPLNRWYECHCYPSVEGLSVYFHDVTERKSAEAHVLATLESIGDGFLACDADWNLVYVNEPAERQLNLRREDMLGRNHWELFPLAIGTRLETEYRRAAAGEFRSFENFYEPWGRWFQLRCFPRAGGGISVYFQDITERKAADEALRESEERFRTLFNAMQESFALGEIICDAAGKPTDWRYLDVNPAFEVMFGRKREEVVGQTYRGVFGSSTASYWVAALGEVALTGDPANLSQGDPDSGRHYEAIAYSPRAGQFAAIFSDVTERRRAEERMRQTQKLESIGLLAGGIAHDFNNLLTGIMGNASMILDEVSPAAAERVKDVIENAERAASLTRQLLAYSGKGKFVVKDVDVSHAVQEIADLVQFSVPKSVEMALSVQKRIPKVSMDPSQLQQILMNLVINAGEAIGEGNPGKILIATSLAEIEKPFTDAIGEQLTPGRYIRIDVSDTGCGIDEEDRSRIFDPFFSTKFTGRGLGLAAVAGIIRSQKGGISLETQPGKGTCFQVFLPASEKRASQSQTAPLAEGRRSVLVVDDEATVRDFIAAVLQRRGYRVLLAADGRDALAVCDKEDRPVDAAVIDVVMPVMGANDLLPTLRSRQPGVKILLTSGYSEAEARRLCAAYPGAAFIQKPYTARQIFEAVERLLGVSAASGLS